MSVLGSIVAVVAGLVVIAWGIACLRGRFPRNVVAGYRTRASLASLDAWNAAQRGSGPWLVAGGAALAATGAVGIVAGLQGAAAVAGIALGAGVVLLLVCLVASGPAAHRTLHRHLHHNE